MSGPEEDAIQLILKRVLDDQHDWSLDHSHKPGPIDSFAEAEAAVTALLAEARKDEVELFREAMINHSTPMIYAPKRIAELAALRGKSDA